MMVVDCSATGTRDINRQNQESQSPTFQCRRFLAGDLALKAIENPNPDPSQ